jgi:hypothetical protein
MVSVSSGKQSKMARVSIILSTVQRLTLTGLDVRVLLDVYRLSLDLRICWKTIMSIQNRYSLSQSPSDAF